MADGFRIAFCIECHKYTPVLQELCRQLQHPEADIFIHVDAKSDIRDFAPLRPLARFIHPRSKVYWGEYGQIDCMLKLLRATCNGDYRYIAILSGDTLPLRPCGQIHDFLEACYPRQFADMQPELHITELTQKMQWCHYPDRNDWIGRLPGYFRKGSTNGCAPGTTPISGHCRRSKRVPTGSSSPTASGILCSIICAPTPIISAHSDTRTAATRSFSRP